MASLQPCIANAKGTCIRHRLCYPWGKVSLSISSTILLPWPFSALLLGPGVFRRSKEESSLPLSSHSTGPNPPGSASGKSPHSSVQNSAFAEALGSLDASQTQGLFFLDDCPTDPHHTHHFSVYRSMGRKAGRALQRPNAHTATA